MFFTFPAAHYVPSMGRGLFSQFPEGKRAAAFCGAREKCGGKPAGGRLTTGRWPGGRGARGGCGGGAPENAFDPPGRGGKAPESLFDPPRGCGGLWPPQILNKIPSPSRRRGGRWPRQRPDGGGRRRSRAKPVHCFIRIAGYPTSFSMNGSCGKAPESLFDPPRGCGGLWPPQILNKIPSPSRRRGGRRRRSRRMGVPHPPPPPPEGNPPLHRIQSDQISRNSRKISAFLLTMQAQIRYNILCYAMNLSV